MDENRSSYFKTPKYTRGRVCKVMGISKDTLRYYEENGLINPWTNPHNKYKYYSIADLEILGVILFMRSIDVSISDIPKAMQGKDIDAYSVFLNEQSERIEEKICYFNHALSMLSYLKDLITQYKKFPDEDKIETNINFYFHSANFSYKYDNIEDMAPHIKSKNATYHIIKLKIVDSNWINHNRERESDVITGHLCSEFNVTDEKHEHIVIPNALKFTTFCELENIPYIIKEKRQKYSQQYIFEEKAYIIEHVCVNVYNQDALLRNIYIPIIALHK